MGSKTVIIRVLSTFSTVHYIRKVWTFSSQRFLAAASWAAVPAAIYSVPRPGAAGFAHGWVGATISYDATETMMPKCLKAPPPN
jgi:hypothetical protein